MNAQQAAAAGVLVALLFSVFEIMPAEYCRRVYSNGFCGLEGSNIFKGLVEF